MLSERDIRFISLRASTNLKETERITVMLEEGMSVPFISRYRKEQTGNMDEERVNAVSDSFDLLKEINKRKSTILRTIEQQGKLTAEIRDMVLNGYSVPELEDIYLPFKPRRKTKASVAREMGLEPMADLLLDPNVKGSPERIAEKFENSLNPTLDIKDSLEYSGHIIAERFSENSGLRKKMREYLWNSGFMTSSVKKEFRDRRSKFEKYYDFHEAVKKIPSHRVLAVFRGEKEGFLKKGLDSDLERKFPVFRALLFHHNHERASYLNGVFEDSVKRLLFPSIENEIMAELKAGADENALSVFASNLEKILLSPPAGNLNVMAIDPGFRTGCKVAILDRTGKLIDHTTIFPTQPREEIGHSAEIVNSLIKKYSIDAVAIGNGTASRETFSFVRDHVGKDIIVSVVSESGASVYSASKAGRDEFPDLDVTVRGAISIGRRFQDPLSELVKIEPGSIGVGQYQHDVDQRLLAVKLDHVVSSAVNRVGVDVNHSSEHILRYVSGIGPTLAANIVSYRNSNGMFRNREELKKVEKFGEKSFIQSAGFLRISGGERVLDSTGIHPESYSLVDRVSRDLGLGVHELIGNTDVLRRINIDEYLSESAGEYTLKDIIAELMSPGRDPRDSFEPVAFDDSVNSMDDLSEGMVLNGIVTNVTNFGVFIDIGVHQDGLAHISELSEKYVRSPEDILSPGDKVRARVISIDRELGRIGLSLKPPDKKDDPG